ncbi:unnamed protein product, partial [Staurois parvus]
MLLTLMVNGKNAPYISGQRKECFLRWWSLGRMLLTLVVNGKNSPVSGKNVQLHTGGQYFEYSPYN